MKTVIKIFAALTLLFMTSSFAAAQNSLVKHINQDEFRAQICDFVQSPTWQYKGKKPCVIDFYATWCGPCRMLTPILEQVDFVDVVKVDVDEARELAMQFKISVVPTLVLFKNNVEISRKEGYMTLDELEKWVKSA